MARFTFPRSRRLHGKLTFRANYETGLKDTRGPLVTFSLPNDLNYPRMGLSVSRKVGTAPRRNLIKRRLREAFRLLQHDWPRGYDLVIVVRPHQPLSLAEYQKLMSGLLVRVHNAWKKKCAGS